MSGIFCVESYWSDALTDESSVRGLLQSLSGARGLRTAHRVVHGREALLDRLKQWSSPRSRAFGVCYLAFHGSPGTLYAGDDEVTLDDIASTLQGRCAGRRLHLGACSTGAVDEADLRELRRVTGAQWVSGYTTDVDWIESAALDLILLDWLADDTAPPAAVRRALFGWCEGLAQRLGLVTVTRSEVRAAIAGAASTPALPLCAPAQPELNG